MTWISENLQILATLGSALAVYIFIRMGSRKEASEIKSELKEIRNEISLLKDRVSRIEGQLIGPPHWELRDFHRTGSEKNQ